MSLTGAAADFPQALRPLLEAHRYKIAYGGRGGGKCLAPGTRIVMWDGSLRAIEEIRVGEDVMGPDGESRLVLGTTTGWGKLYRVRQTSGMTYVVNDAHILTLKKSRSAGLDRGELSAGGNPRRPNGRYPAWGAITDIPLPDYVKQSARWKANFRGFRAGALRFPAQDVPVDPYFLGIWLGDGLWRELMVTTADEEIVEACAEVAARAYCRLTIGGKPNNQARDIRIGRRAGRKTNPVWQKMRGLGLGFDKDGKHIPECYLVNDESVRLQLLAGLVDSDGYKHNKGYQIVQTSERLAGDIKRLVDGLGFRTRMVERATVCGNNGVRGTAFSVTFSGDTWRVPCRVKRKIVHKEDLRKNKDWLLSEITVEECGDGFYAGIALSGDGRFLLEDGTVTHNSWGIATYLLAQAAARPLRILCCREFQTSIRESVHRLLSDMIAKHKLNDRFEVLEKSIRSKKGSEFLFEGLRHNVGRIRSLEGVDKVWVEEASNVSRSSWEVLIPTIRKEGSEIIVSFNPELESDETYQRFVLSPPRDSVVMKVNYPDNPWFPEVLRREMEDLRERDFDAYAHVYLGECRLTLDGAIYAKELRDATEEGRIGPVPYDRSKGVDVYCDLGWADMTALWLAQHVAGEVRLIDYLEDNQRPFNDYLRMLQAKPYVYGTLWLPHDAQAKSLGTGRSIEEIARNAGWRVRIVPRLSVADGINAVRTLFPQMWFDRKRCADGVQALRHYRYDLDANGQFSRQPLHDEASHGADALRYVAVALSGGRRPGGYPTEPPRRRVWFEPRARASLGWMGR